MSYKVFFGRKEMDDFFGTFDYKIENSLEKCVFKGYKKSRVLFTAEHAVTRRLRTKSGIVFGVGDVNTGLLARLGAYHARGAYLIPRKSRIRVDLCRPGSQLGKGVRLFAKILEGPGKREYISIHKDRKALGYFLNYHRIIEELAPHKIVSVHGMAKDRKFDVMLGFGKRWNFIGGKRNAFKFRREFKERLESEGIELKVAIAKNLFTGQTNYTLRRHVQEWNKAHPGEKRIGVHVEWNSKGRGKKGSCPSVDYQ